MKTKTTAWRDVKLGSSVILKGNPWELLAVEKAGGGKLRVTVKAGPRKFSATVGKKDTVEVVPDLSFAEIMAKVSKKQDEERARKKLEARQNAPKPKRHKKPDFVPDPAGWGFSPDGDAAEAAIREGLDAKLVGVKLGADEAYIVPLVDPSTIAGHLFLFHGIGPVNLRKRGGWEEAVKIHEGEHERLGGEARIPHFHDKDRPEVARGPRFR